MSDITYEELTPSSFSPFYHLFYFKSDITYEELTPIVYMNSELVGFPLCRTLPMRN